MNLPRILITGGTGLLGKALMESIPDGWEVLATFHRNPPVPEWRAKFHFLDVRDEPSVQSLVKEFEPEVVIHTASIGSVDEAERNPELVRQVNVGGTQNVGRACEAVGAFLIFISSNAVFDGKNPPYAEESPLSPANRYGALKAKAEIWIRQRGLDHLILRPILMYGWPFPGGRDNVVTRWLHGLENGQSIEVANDVTSMPLLAANCAEVIWKAAQRRKGGILHVAGKERVPLATFAREVASLFDCKERLVIPVPSSQLRPGLAPRPRDTSFLTQRMEEEFGVRPLGIHEGVTLLKRSRPLCPTI